MGLQQFIVTTGTSRQRYLFRFLSSRVDRAEPVIFFCLCDAPPAGRRLNISAENDCRRLHCSLRDLSSLLQAVGRLAEHFIGEIFAARFTDALAVVERSACLTLSNMQNGFVAAVYGTHSCYRISDRIIFTLPSTEVCLHEK